MPEQISATIEIAATPEHVWAVLADLASYPRWHPVFRQVTGQLAAGSKIILTTTHPTTDRGFVLTPIDGGTLLRQTATYRGLFARFPAKTITRIQDTFAAINQAIKEQAEARQQAPG